MRDLNAQRDDAELHVLNLNRAESGLPPWTRSSLSSPNSPSIRNTPTDEIFAPNGDLVGWRQGSAGLKIRTVNRDTFESLALRSTFGSEPMKPSDPRYTGEWFRRADGCIIGCRISPQSGPTIDIVQYGFNSNLTKVKIHVRD